ncbi:arylsulfatase A-like enzyme [Kribbella aluminosa]|uniref:Arylsulfatase A-like enzyme n=1 Tax=Kribbella aluminosa TaxID=416017 RepID=A0ABS4UJ02_9ACTN|nr:sulfatase-like hydrolase/transferase [Kribbella aluminosa]MBP2351585.1 arylsulfatase A-like enzyme [Kribbella aluminosa]
MSPRHVVLLIADQFQHQRLGTADPLARTPHLDRLASEGVNYTGMFCSNPQCTPSRVSMQTGLYPHEAGVLAIYGFRGHTGHLSPDRLTVGKVFRDAGWTTAYFGKSHLGHPLDALGYQHVQEHGVSSPLSAVDRTVTADAVRFVAEHDPEQPLFLTVSWHEPHPAFEHVAPFDEHFPPEEMPIPATYDDDLIGKPPYQAERRAMPHGGVGLDRLRDELSSYYSMISHIDSLVGDVRGALEARGMWDDAVVLFTSDHGDMMGAHGFRLKGVLPYDELYRIPFVLKVPGLPVERSVVDDLCVNVAQPGTLLAAAGLPVPAEMSGGSVLDRAMRPAPPADECVFLEHYAAYWGLHPFRVARTRNWKYVRHFGETPWEELYDLAADPGELRNVVGRGDLAGTRAELRRRVDEWWESTDGRDLAYYESDDFRNWGRATLVSDNALWNDAATSQ